MSVLELSSQPERAAKKPYCISAISRSQVPPILQLASHSLSPPSQTLCIEVVPKLLLASPWQLISGAGMHSKGEVRPRFQVQLWRMNLSLSIRAFGWLTWSTKCQWNQTIKDLALYRFSEDGLNSLIKWQNQLSLRWKFKDKLNSLVEIWRRNPKKKKSSLGRDEQKVIPAEKNPERRNTKYLTGSIM